MRFSLQQVQARGRRKAAWAVEITDDEGEVSVETFPDRKSAEEYRDKVWRESADR